MQNQGASEISVTAEGLNEDLQPVWWSSVGPGLAREGGSGARNDF